MSDRFMLARFGKIATLVIGALALSACGINSIPTKEEAAKSQWGNVESSYQRRADLIPNLISTVQAAAISENNILRQVTDARARATGITVTTDDLSNPEEFRKFSEAQNQLTQALGQLRTVVENYPQLQSQQGFRDLMVAMEGAENQINVERMRYNEAAQECAKNADAASKKIFEDLVADEEGHADTFDQQIQFIERFGERFLALQSLQQDAE